jgi:tetratricopeptide (TPR) repeat protein/energy-coupling factor transporter ATP-binding protein EcfA2
MNIAARGQAALKAAVPAPPPSAGDDSALSAERPFPGLRPFCFADRDYFFGRERQVFALYRLVENGRFIAVIGSSGSGKSSLVLAGLMGLLAEESADSGGPSWVCLDMRPGASPLSRLAKTLARLAGNDSPDAAARRREGIEYRLRRSGFSLESALEEAGGLGGRTLLLIVDQFEELFRFGLAGLGLRRPAIEEAKARDEATQFVQILLDADRRRLKDVRVLITMRSDFIGDCAYFHGLSEAVSATQYLVPNLTRSQLEDVIRKPIEKAGATIEPELVERLINDCGDELDQLPVLQHCLMRLWDRAGGARPDGVAAADATEPPPQCLTRQTYDEIGRMTEALSHHADEILHQCAGKELAVEQAFRALSELDREGRAIRRALRFDKLLAETGVSEQDLRAVLDKFRAPTCSFLVPPPSVSPALSTDDRVDIGHEALLRRWKAIAGDANAAVIKSGGCAKGWLNAEQADGQRYRTLVSLLGGDAGGEKATLTNPEDTKRWWDRLPRTAAWSERYGGNFDAVRKLIDDNIAAKRQLMEAQRKRKRNRLIGYAVIVACVGLIAAMFVGQAYEARQAATRGEMTAARGLLDQFRDEYIKGSITEAGSRSLAQMIEAFVSKLRGSAQTLEADKLWVEFLNVKADLSTNSEKPDEALAQATAARDLAESLVSRDPTDAEVLQEKFDSLTRIGDARMTWPYTPDKIADAFANYSEALSTALALRSLDKSEKPDDDLAKAHLKLGDLYRDADPPLTSDALQEYATTLALSGNMLRKSPNDKDALRDHGWANYRTGLEYISIGSWDRAYAAFGDALSDQTALADKYPDDETVRSNLAATYNRLGDLWMAKHALIEALSAYNQGVKLQEEIVENDPRAPRYRDWLSGDYRKMANLYERLNLTSEMRATLRTEYVNRKELAQIDKTNCRWQAKYARAAKELGDHVGANYQLSLYREALGLWAPLAMKPEGRVRLIGSYYDLLQMADAFAAAKLWADAESAYAQAAYTARLNSVVPGSDTAWEDLIDRAASAAAEAGAHARR